MVALGLVDCFDVGVYHAFAVLDQFVLENEVNESMAELDLRHDQLQFLACVWFEDHLIICPPDRCRLQNGYFRLNRSVVWLVLDCLLWLDLVR